MNHSIHMVHEGRKLCHTGSFYEPIITTVLSQVTCIHCQRKAQKLGIKQPTRYELYLAMQKGRQWEGK